jgi:hypothetical protein
VTKTGLALPVGMIGIIGNPDSICTVYNISFVTVIKTNNALFAKRNLFLLLPAFTYSTTVDINMYKHWCSPSDVNGCKV